MISILTILLSIAIIIILLWIGLWIAFIGLAFHEESIRYLKEMRKRNGRN